MTTSASNSISELELTKETMVRHTDTLKRHKRNRRKCFASNAPLFIAPHLRWRKTANNRLAGVPQ
jgi:hypothetical protein